MKPAIAHISYVHQTWNKLSFINMHSGYSLANPCLKYRRLEQNIRWRIAYGRYE